MVDKLEQDFLFRGSLEELDADVAELVRHETARQARTIIMIPSESTIPEAVRDAVGSSFQNIYAEGYPSENMRHMDEQDILDYETRLSEFRRNSDARYYKGTEYANMLESLARRRAAVLGWPCLQQRRRRDPQELVRQNCYPETGQRQIRRRPGLRNRELGILQGDGRDS